MHRFSSFLLLCVIIVMLSSVSVRAQSINDLGWMSGLWMGNQNGVLMEEYWTEPAGGSIIGLHRDTFTDSTSFFEFVRIEETDEGIIYFAQPRGVPATKFRISEFEDQTVTFSNPDHDFPQNLHYKLIQPDTLEVAISGLSDGEFKKFGWKWVRSTIKNGDE